jgi:hypothetical protein
LVKKMSGCSEMWPNSNPDILSLYTVMANWQQHFVHLFSEAVLNRSVSFFELCTSSGS